MLAPYGTRFPVTGVFDLLDRWCATKTRAAMAASGLPGGGTAGGFRMPTIGAGGAPSAQEECYQAAYIGQRGLYSLWAVQGVTVEITGGSTITVGPITCLYESYGYGCSTNPGGLCTPYIPGTGTTYVDIPIPGRLYATSALDPACPVAALYECPTIWILASQMAWPAKTRAGTTTWRAIALIEDDGSENSDTAWAQLASDVDIEDEGYYGDSLASGDAPSDPQYRK